MAFQGSIINLVMSLFIILRSVIHDGGNILLKGNLACFNMLQDRGVTLLEHRTELRFPSLVSRGWSDNERVVIGTALGTARPTMLFQLTGAFNKGRNGSRTLSILAGPHGEKVQHAILKRRQSDDSSLRLGCRCMDLAFEGSTRQVQDVRLVVRLMEGLDKSLGDELLFFGSEVNIVLDGIQELHSDHSIEITISKDRGGSRSKGEGGGEDSKREFHFQ